MREIIHANKELARKISLLERKVSGHDDDIKTLITTIRQMIQKPKTRKKEIGFKRN